MGKRQSALKDILGGSDRVGRLPMPTATSLSASALDETLREMYQWLGGRQQNLPPRRGRWDVEFGGMAIELDEERHFNRYRLLTLDHAVYERSSAFPRDEYRSYCRGREPECLRAGRWGRYWTTPSAEAHFGPSDAEGVLGRHGSACWRQRAYYDFMKDMASLVLPVGVCRLSVWDSVEVAGQPSLLGFVLRMWDAQPVWNRREVRLAVSEHVRRRSMI